MSAFIGVVVMSENSSQARVEELEKLLSAEKDLHADLLGKVTTID